MIVESGSKVAPQHIADDFVFRAAEHRRETNPVWVREQDASALQQVRRFAGSTWVHRELVYFWFDRGRVVLSRYGG
jgi:hypothetical protein